MKRLVHVSWACCVLLLAQVSSAAVFERDWQTPGDGLLTYDDVNNREWLDLSQTILSSQFPGNDPSPQITRELRYQYVVGQTGPGGLFDGFRVAKSVDAVALAQSAGINTSTLNAATNSSAALTLGQLLEFTFVGATGSKIAIGLLDELPSDRPFGPPIRPGALIHSAFNQAGLAIDESHFQYPTPPGVMLYRLVPEPTAMALAVLALSAIALEGRQSRRFRLALHAIAY